MSSYRPAEIEKKWQEQWENAGLYRVNLAADEKIRGIGAVGAFRGKYYLLVELPYPSGDLHMGHWFTFAVTDILGRMKRMQGFNVFFPVGFDAFGLPAENAAIRRGINPREWTYGNIEAMKKQFATMGGMHDFEHGVITCDSDYYRWNQWIFLKMFEKGLAYRGKTLSNWCPKDQTVLANENVEAGKCWRCGTEVVQKEVEQWFLKITEYAERLLWRDTKGPNEPKEPGVDWPQSVREGQNNWIGKSEGIEIEFRIKNLESRTKENITVFTKFPETIFGVTFMVVAPEYQIAVEVAKKEKEVAKYVEQAKRKSELERTSIEKDKTGVFTGLYCINPVNNESVPIWVADYVIGTYGTGAVMGVPGSDVRDFQFAKKYDIPVIQVIAAHPRGVPGRGKAHSGGESKGESDFNRDDVLEEGFIVNSGQFNGLQAPRLAKGKFIDFLEKKGWGKRKVNYHLHDWSISRQRYWGTPIPIIHCPTCGTVPVPEKDLPVELPKITDYAPHGKPPLAAAEEWVNVKCPNCGGDAKREVDTMDTFVDSSWYFLRYVDPKDEKWIFDKRIVAKWLPVELYVGGAEHTLGHTLYSRFFVKFLHDIGEVPFEEYAYKRIHHGVILGPDGQRMSKSHGNVVNPDEQVAKYGADAVRMYLAFMGPYDLVAPWNPNGLRGVYHFLQRVWDLGGSFGGPVSSFPPASARSTKLVTDADSDGGELRADGSPSTAATPKTLSSDDLFWMHKTIKKVTEDVAEIKYNTAVAALMEWMNYLGRKAHNGGREGKEGLEGGEGVTVEEYKTMLLLLAPFAPHMTEELYQQFFANSKSEIRNPKLKKEDSIHSQSWPKFDEGYIKAESVTIVVQVNGKVRERLLVEAGADQKTIEKLALESEKVQKFLGKNSPRKIIYVPGKLVNFVV